MYVVYRLPGAPKEPGSHVANLTFYRFSGIKVRVSDMEEYRPPKLLGKKAPLNCLVLPTQHHSAWKATKRYNMSFGEYIGALIDRAEGRPNKLDGMQQKTTTADDL